jgi:hypothetical protein
LSIAWVLGKGQQFNLGLTASRGFIHKKKENINV